MNQVSQISRQVDTNAAIQDAMMDVVAIRRSIASFQSNKDGQIVAARFFANKTLQSMALVMSALLAAFEVFGHDIITTTMLEKNADPHWRIFGVGCMAMILSVCVANMYMILQKAASKNQDDLESYIRRNFAYLQNRAHISDLIIKFLVITALIVGQKPEWVAPFLFLFTGDYLFQNRFFTLSSRMSQALAVASVLWAGVQFYFGNALLFWPLVWFAVVSLCSLRHLMSLKRVED